MDQDGSEGGQLLAFGTDVSALLATYLISDRQVAPRAELNAPGLTSFLLRP
jgi:hypothetical protein